MQSPEKAGNTLERSSNKKMMKMLGTSNDEIERAKQLAKLKAAKSTESVFEERKLEQRGSFIRRLKFPATYPFSQEDSAACILLEDDNTQIRAGSLPKLVERLTYYEEIDPNYLFEFLLTYRSFTTPRDFLKLLIDRWNMPTPAEIQKEEKDLESFKSVILKPIRLRVFNVLKRWIEDHWYDWEADSTLVSNVKSFIDANINGSGMENVGSTLNKLIAKKLEGVQNDTTIVHVKPPPEPHEPDVRALRGTGGNAAHLAFLAFHPEEIARQITLIEWNLFKSIKPWECTGQSWAKSGKETKAPNILGMILRFNKVSMWVKNTLVQTESLRSRIEALTKFIDVADYLRSINNFNGIMEVLAGLRSAAVHRLRKTWEGISSKHQKVFDELSELMSPYSNYTKFRNYLHKAISPPCIPYLGVYLTDLTFIEDGNPDSIQADLINFDKRRRIAAVIGEIKQYQQTPYNFTVVPIIKGFLLAGGEYVDENECYKLSLVREPKEISKEAKEKDVPSTPELKKKISVANFMRKSITLKKRSSSKSESGSNSPSPSPTPSSPIASSPPSRTFRSISIDTIVENALEGNYSSIDYYLDSLTSKSDKEKETVREEINRLIEHRQRAYEDEIEEIPFDLLVGFLDEGNNVAFEKYLENFDYYDAELIRAQAIEQYTKKMALQML